MSYKLPKFIIVNCPQCFEKITETDNTKYPPVTKEFKCKCQQNKERE